MNIDSNILIYAAIALGAIFTLVIGCASIGLVAWFLLRQKPRGAAALATHRKSSKVALDEDLEAVVEIFARHREELRLDAVRGQMVEAASKKA